MGWFDSVMEFRASAVRRGGTAAAARGCLIVRPGECDALCCTDVLFTMRRTFSTAQYAGMAFIYGFCNENGRAAAAEYWRRYPQSKLLSLHVVKCVRNLQGEWFSVSNRVHRMVFWMQCSTLHTQVYAREPRALVMHRHKYGQFCKPTAFIRITRQEHTSCRKTTHTVCNVVKDYRHTWTFFLTLSSRTGLSLPLMVLTVHGIITLGRTKIYTRQKNVIFSAVFQ